MVRINKEVRDQFDFFLDLLSGSKVISESNIPLIQKRNNAYWETAQSKVAHETIEDELGLIVEQSKRDNKYGIKLRCSSLTGEPFFRFDSDGPAHRNDNPLIPLEDQSVSTPHFNSYDRNGKSIAYKNSPLKIPTEAEAIVNDLNLGIPMFCMEANCYLANGGFPLIGEKEPELGFEGKIEVNFDNIDFK